MRLFPPERASIPAAATREGQDPTQTDKQAGTDGLGKADTMASKRSQARWTARWTVDAAFGDVRIPHGYILQQTRKARGC